MRRKALWFVVVAAVATLCFVPVLSHHNAEGIVDEEVSGMIDDGLMSYVAMLDGDVTMTISFEDRPAVTTTVTRTP